VQSGVEIKERRQRTRAASGSRLRKTDGSIGNPEGVPNLSSDCVNHPTWALRVNGTKVPESGTATSEYYARICI
jgi:hypothetical protein